MLSSNFGDQEPVLNLNSLFEDKVIGQELKEKVDKLQKNDVGDNLILLNEIKEILHNCTHLTPEQKLMYCQSQRYFMKLYLREVNKEMV
jgi:hypothetical protein